MRSNILCSKEIHEKLNSSRDKILLLGNGFTLGCGSTENIPFERFSQVKLLEDAVKKIIANFGENSNVNSKNTKFKEYCESILNNKKEKNLEYHLLMFDELVDIIQFFDKTEYSYDKFESKDIEYFKKELKEAVLNVFSESHPKSFDSISQNSEQLDCARAFIKKFHRIYTLNYDLLLYWLIQGVRKEDGKMMFRDGFTVKLKEDENLLMITPKNNQFSLHFLHGAIHLIEKPLQQEKSILKICRSINRTPITSLAEVIDLIKSKYIDWSNIIILEGSSSKKRELIRRNDYLWRCFDRLSSEKNDGIIFIYGCSIVRDDNLKINNDEHIWRSIMNNNVREICISIHEDFQSISSETQKRINAISEELMALVDSDEKKQNKQIYFYSSIDSDIWRFSD